VQEYFAAVALQETARQEQRLSSIARFGWNIQEVLTQKKIGLNALASEDWWMETLVQLAGIIEDPTWLARTLARTNPWLAWWCVQEGRLLMKPRVPGSRIVQNNLLKSTRLDDRRRRCKPLCKPVTSAWYAPCCKPRQMKIREVSRLAVQGLVDMGEGVQATVVELLHDKDEGVWKTVLLYLSTNPESPLWSNIAERVRADGGLMSEARNRLQKQADTLPFKNGNLESLLRKLAPSHTLARIESGQISPHFWKPPWGEPEWITIPASEFWMGDDKSQFDDQKPAHKVALPEYQIDSVR